MLKPQVWVALGAVASAPVQTHVACARKGKKPFPQNAPNSPEPKIFGIRFPDYLPQTSDWFNNPYNAGVNYFEKAPPGVGTRALPKPWPCAQRGCDKAGLRLQLILDP